ncbi:type I-C CRISPR-associated protein Cas5c [Caballeronia sordidicola]|uniref:pre-crRNA processing endonuclease n=1 Tax=Caballeronia sordidicola TaxID=196367 RepID=A0A226WJX0_CABSO|nr:type I-C CRISPR-associated protein Cas5c [Caballeronia sordidicola]OXC71496.1 CRISPR-associated protein, Cas5d family [Caballeronia sordidicola]
MSGHDEPEWSVTFGRNHRSRCSGIPTIHWKPAIRWVVDRIQVLNEIRFDTIRRNEVASKIPASSARSAMKNGTLKGLVNYVDEDRQQRAAYILKDVAYIIEAHIELTDKAEEGDSIGKHLDIFNRRARKGQCFQIPCPGVREFPACFSLLEDDAPLCEPHSSLMKVKDLGWMLHDIDFKNAMTPHFFRASMKDGWIDVPPLPFVERPA